MRRFGTILLLVAMAVMCIVPCYSDETVPISETAASVREYAKDIVLQLADIYDKSPEGFDADYVFMLHGFAQMCIAADEAYNASIHVEYKTAGEVMNESTRKDSRKTIYSLYEKEEEYYKSWLNGNISDREYCDAVMVLMRVLVA